MHLGVISVPINSHVSTLIALAMRLQQRGHRVTFFHIADMEQMIRKASLEFCCVGGRQFPTGSMAKRDAQISRLIGLAGFRFTIEYALRHSQMLLDEAPEAITASNIDMLLVDQSEPAGSTLAEGLGVPFVSVAVALPLPESFDSSVPPFFVGWRYRRSVFGRLRNRLALWLFAALVLPPFFELLNRTRRSWGLQMVPDHKPEFRRCALIAQLPACLDFPQRERRPDFHYSGPFSIETVRPEVPFPWDQIDGRPLVYVGFGNQSAPTAATIRAAAEAGAQLNMQVVISLGHFHTRESLGPLSGNPILARVAPQLDLIRQSALVVHHGGLNTTLEALWYGVPMVVIPITNDQPGIAARIEWAGAGTVVAARRVTTQRLRKAMKRVTCKPRYKEAAERLGAEIRAVDGLNRAADIVERALQKGGFRESSG